MKEQSADSIDDPNALQLTTKDDSIISDLMRDNAWEESETERTIAEDELAEGKVDLVAECDVLDRDDLEDEEEDADVPTSFHEIIRKDLDAYILEIKQQVQERGFVANEPKIDLTLRESEIAEVSVQDFFDISR